MIFDRFFAGEPTARLLPAERLHGPTVAVMAIMSFAMTLVAAAGLALASASASVASAAESTLVVQFPAASDLEFAQSLEKIRALPGVRAVRPIPEQEMRQTLERWLGDAASSKDLPVPALATVDLAPGADPARLSQAVRSASPEAGVSSGSGELQPLLRSIRALQMVAIGLVLLMAAADGAAIVLAARGALDTHRSTVAIMHGIGATDYQVTRLFVRKIAVDAVAGALAGTLLAGIVLFVVGGQLAAAAGGFGSSASLGPFGFVALAAIPVAVVLLVIGVARRTLLASLRETL